MYQHFEFLFVAFATQFDKIITTDAQSCAKHVGFIHYAGKFVPIMLALCSMLLPPIMLIIMLVAITGLKLNRLCLLCMPSRCSTCKIDNNDKTE